MNNYITVVFMFKRTDTP